MEPLTTLPWIRVVTDNLYKFMALAGLASFFLSNGFLYIQTHRLREQLIDTEVERLVLEEDEKLLKLELKEFQAEIDAIEARVAQLEKAGQPLNPTKGQELKNMLENLDSKLEASLRRRFELTKLGHRLAGKQALNDFLEKELQRDRILTVFFSLLCGGVASVGFLLWYLRLQKFQDIIVQKQASSREEETTPLINSSMRNENSRTAHDPNEDEGP